MKDLLPDREGETLQAWLKTHPGIEVVTRDRSAVYAHAVTQAAPEVVQVADRWHLLKNLSENLERYLDTQRSLIKEVAGELNQKPGEVSSSPTGQVALLPNSLEGYSVGRANSESMAESIEKSYPTTSRSNSSNNKVMAAKPLPLT